MPPAEPSMSPPPADRAFRYIPPVRRSPSRCTALSVPPWPSGTPRHCSMTRGLCFFADFGGVVGLMAVLIPTGRKRRRLRHRAHSGTGRRRGRILRVCSRPVPRRRQSRSTIFRTHSANQPSPWRPLPLFSTAPGWTRCSSP